MRIMNQISIKQRLLLMIITSLFLFAVFSLYQVYIINQVYTQISLLSDHPLIVTNSALIAQERTAEIRKDMLELLITPDNTARQLKVQEINNKEKELYGALDVIDNHILGNEGKQLGIEARKLIDEWKAPRDQVIVTIFKNNQEASEQSLNHIGETNLRPVMGKLQEIYEYAQNKAAGFQSEADRLQGANKNIMIYTILAFSIFLMTLYLFVIRSINSSIKGLKDSMAESTRNKAFVRAKIEGNNEITDMVRDYNSLIDTMETQFELINGLNSLSELITGNFSAREIAEKSISFLSEYLDAGNGVFYIYNEESETLNLIASYAFTERNALYESYKIGQGVVGQAALERKPILLKNIQLNEANITTGTIKQAPLNTFTFPLQHHDELCGIIELASFEPFEQSKQTYLKEAAEIIAIRLFKAMLREHNELLLKDAMESNIKLENQQEQLIRQSDEISQQNIKLQELLDISQKQSDELQVQQEELRQSNEELEEQSRALSESRNHLQHQQEELRVVNEELEERNGILKAQKDEIYSKNQHLMEIQKELIGKGEALEAAYLYKSEFLSNMSHELRTPLNSIIVLSHLLSENKGETRLDEKQLKFANIIHSSGEDLLTLINDILDLSKIEAGKMEIELEYFNVEELVQYLENTFVPQAMQKGLSFSVVNNKGTPESICSDIHRVKQILNNLISNAYKFTNAGEITVTIDLHQNGMFHERNSGTGNVVTISVADTGIGVSPEKQKVIFEAFRQSDGATSRKFGGTGLGLSISKELAELLGGSISLESEEGKGSTFTLIIPECYTLPKELVSVESIESTELIDADDEEFKRNEAYTADRQSTGDMTNDKGNSIFSKGVIEYIRKPVSLENMEEMFGKIGDIISKSLRRLLILDKDIEYTQKITSIMKANGIDVTSFSSGKQALQLLETEHFDCIVLDISMEDMSGFEFLDEMKSGNHADIPVIVHTGDMISVEDEAILRKLVESIIIKGSRSIERLVSETNQFLHEMNNNIEAQNTERSNHLNLRQDNLSNKRILIVDDDMRSVYTLSSLLEENAIQVVTGYNGKDGIQKLHENPDIDLVIMDIMMPEMDGYTAIREIRNDHRYSNLPIIALTAKAMREDRQRCIEAGASDYLTKPIDTQKLISLLRVWLYK